MKVAAQKIHFMLSVTYPEFFEDTNIQQGVWYAKHSQLDSNVLCDMLQSTYKRKSALTIFYNQRIAGFYCLLCLQHQKIKVSAVFNNKQFVLMSKMVQLLIRRRNYKQYCNSFLIFLGARVRALIPVYWYQDPAGYIDGCFCHKIFVSFDIKNYFFSKNYFVFLCVHVWNCKWA